MLPISQQINNLCIFILLTDNMASSRIAITIALVSLLCSVQAISTSCDNSVQIVRCPEMLKSSCQDSAGYALLPIPNLFHPCHVCVCLNRYRSRANSDWPAHSRFNWGFLCEEDICFQHPNPVAMWQLLVCHPNAMEDVFLLRILA